MIPRIDQALDSIQTGVALSLLPKDKYLICIDDNGLKSAHAVIVLKRYGYHAKTLLGGIESLDGIVELKIGYV